MKMDSPSTARHLILVLGDQLDPNSAAFDGFDAAQDAVWMAEVVEESTHVWSHKVRTAVFLSAMRHFRESLQKSGRKVHYRQLEDSANAGSLAGELAATVKQIRPQRLIMIEPGDWRVLEELKKAAAELKIELQIRPDRHFYCSREDFAEYASRHKQLRMEFFYREMRAKTGVLMDGKKPAGDQWNFDPENRKSFGRSGPGNVPTPMSFPPDEITREVIALVERKFAKHPGSLAHFDWPVTAEQARTALDDFITHRLPHFGQYQDAMWSEEGEMFARPFLYHSRLSSVMNLKLLDPRQVIAAAEQAYQRGQAPLAGVEGFIRQILGWREFVRGVYWQFMPQYRELNALNAQEPLPWFYWTGKTEMNCLRHALGQTLNYGYAHHIQRLMVTGLFTLLLGVKPQWVHEWYLAVYVDAIEWVELPNTLGMSQYGDGGIMDSKPYIASGKYIQRMSNYCTGCRFDPAKATGDNACPFTTLYWDFLMRHEKLLTLNPRMAMQLKNLARLNSSQREEIRAHAENFRTSLRSKNKQEANY